MLSRCGIAADAPFRQPTTGKARGVTLPVVSSIGNYVNFALVQPFRARINEDVLVIRQRK